MVGLAGTYAAQLRRVAVDVTDESVRRSTLVLAPHPDDETLGCGGTTWLKRRAGTEVTVVVATDGRFSHTSELLGPDELADIRRAESRSAATVLGVAPSQVVFLDHPERSLMARFERLREQIAELLDEYEPAELVVPSPIDRLADHQALHRAALAAAVGHHEPLIVLEYPIWMWDAQAWVDPTSSAVAKAGQLVVRPFRALRTLRPVTVDVSTAIPVKRQALGCYRSQMTNLTGEPGWPTMDPRFVEQFLASRELFFAVDVHTAVSPRAPRRRHRRASRRSRCRAARLADPCC